MKKSRRKCYVAIAIFIIVSLFSICAFAQEIFLPGQAVDKQTFSQIIVPNTIVDSGIDQSSNISPEWGTTSYTVLHLGPADLLFRPGSGDYYTSSLTQYVGVAAGSTTTAIAFPVHVPAGAIIKYLRLYYYDNNSDNDPSIGFYKIHFDGSSTTLVASMSPNAWSSGSRYVDFPADETVDNWNYVYVIDAVIHRTPTTEERIYGINVMYQLQVSPEPLTATFSDVPTTHQYFQFIEALADSGITTGYPDGTFRPGSYVTRGQMAVFLSKALGLHWPY
jgi:hypothetical protein